MNLQQSDLDWFAANSDKNYMLRRAGAFDQYQGDACCPETDHCSEDFHTWAMLLVRRDATRPISIAICETIWKQILEVDGADVDPEVLWHKLVSGKSWKLRKFPRRDTRICFAHRPRPKDDEAA